MGTEERTAFFISDKTKTKRLNANVLYFYAKQIGFGHCTHILDPEECKHTSCTAGERERARIIIIKKLYFFYSEYFLPFRCHFSLFTAFLFRFEIYVCRRLLFKNASAFSYSVFYCSCVFSREHVDIVIVVGSKWNCLVNRIERWMVCMRCTAYWVHRHTHRLRNSH